MKQPTASVFSDEQLRELSRQPVTELLAVVRRSSVVQPLVVLLAFLPGLIQFWNPSPDEPTCQEALLALDAAEGPWPTTWLVNASRQLRADSSRALPLATFLTACVLKLDLLLPESRLILASYLSSVVLLLCLGNFAKKLDGNRFALLVVLLAAVHPVFLAMTRGLPPIALPLVFAVLSFRGLLSHQNANGSLIFNPLVGSGVALAACWLSGRELAMPAWCVLLLVSLLTGRAGDSMPARTWKKLLIRGFLNLAARGVGFLVLTGVATVVVLGWENGLSGRINFSDLTLAISSGVAWRPDGQTVSAIQEVPRLCGPLFGFVLLGLIRAIRDLFTKRESEFQCGDRFLLIWLAVALLYWWASNAMEYLNDSELRERTAFLLVALLFMAAWGLEGMLSREFGLGLVASATLVTFIVLSADYWNVPIATFRTVPAALLAIAASILLIFVSVQYLRTVGWSESFRRFATLSCMGVLILASVVEPIFSSQRLSNDERELQALRRQLFDERPKQCWLIHEEATPARLRYFIRSLWNEATFHEAINWEPVLGQLTQIDRTFATNELTPFDRQTSRAVVITWGNVKVPMESSRRSVLTSATAPLYFQGKSLRGYRFPSRTNENRRR